MEGMDLGTAGDAHPKEGIDACLTAVQEAMAAKKMSYKGGGVAKAKGKAKGTAKAKGKGKAKAKAAGKGKAKDTKNVHGRPGMPPLKSQPVIRYHGCSIYSSLAGKKWRAVAHANRRVDKPISWSKGLEGWHKLLDWCEENGDGNGE